jgi:hypothetical protein
MRNERCENSLKGTVMSNPGEFAGDAKKTTDAVMARDRRRIRGWATVTIGLWIVAALLIPSVYLPLGAMVKRYLQVVEADNPNAKWSVMRDIEQKAEPSPPAMQDVPKLVAQLQRQQWMTGKIVGHQWLVGAFIMAMALAAGILASASTVALALTIRRVTLRQVNAGLAEISEQLRRMQST